MERKAEIENLENLVNKKLPSKKRSMIASHTTGTIIASLARYLVRDVGYSVTHTAIMREMRNLGRRDAKKIMEVFEIKEKNIENTKKVLRISALILGLEYDVIDGNIVIVNCPFGDCFKESKEPFFCNVCIEYCRGVVEEMLGPEFVFERHKQLIDGDEFCNSEIWKKS